MQDNANEGLVERLREGATLQPPDFGLAGTPCHTRTVHAWKAGMFDASRRDLLIAADLITTMLAQRDAATTELARLRAAAEGMAEALANCADPARHPVAVQALATYRALFPQPTTEEPGDA